MRENIEPVFWGLTLGSWSQWLIGICFTLINLYISNTRYRKDHRENINIIYSPWVSQKTEGGTTVGEGLSITAINTGTPTKISFFGISAHESRFLRWWRKKSYRIFSRYSVTHKLVKSEYPKKYDCRVLPLTRAVLDHELSGKVRFTPLAGIEDEFSVNFTADELVDTLEALINDHRRFAKKLDKNKPLKFDALLITYSGRLIPMKFILLQDTLIYERLKKSGNSRKERTR